MLDSFAAGFDRQTETRPDFLEEPLMVLDKPLPYGRNYGKPYNFNTYPEYIKSDYRTATAPQVNKMSRTPYLGLELKQTCHRVGAYDAFELPSVIGGERHPYRFSKEATDGL